MTSLPPSTPIACVSGGHESSNAAMVANSDAVVLDLAHLKSIEFHRDGDDALVTVGAGVVFSELVEAVKSQHGALPVGTGQRVVRLTMVTPAGDIRVLTAEDELLTAMLGAGSALGIVVDVTIRMDHESVIQSTEQRVVGFEKREQAVDFSRGALRFMRDHVLADESVSMELVVTGGGALVVTVVFYDSFPGSTAEFVKPLEHLAASLKLPEISATRWGSWYEAAAALWPVIAGLKGNPLATLQHCMGTRGDPDDAVLDFISNTVVAEAPLDEAALSLVEIRTLGGAAVSGMKLPSGNCHHSFFVDLITQYDAEDKTAGQRQTIVDLTKAVIDKARDTDGLTIDSDSTRSPSSSDRQRVRRRLLASSAPGLCWTTRRRATAESDAGNLSECAALLMRWTPERRSPPARKPTPWRGSSGRPTVSMTGRAGSSRYPTGRSCVATVGTR